MASVVVESLKAREVCLWRRSYCSKLFVSGVCAVSEASVARVKVLPAVKQEKLHEFVMF